jgi:hypothetical protein
VSSASVQRHFNLGDPCLIVDLLVRSCAVAFTTFRADLILLFTF